MPGTPQLDFWALAPLGAVTWRSGSKPSLAAKEFLWGRARSLAFSNLISGSSCPLGRGVRSDLAGLGTLAVLESSWEGDTSPGLNVLRWAGRCLPGSSPG